MKKILFTLLAVLLVGMSASLAQSGSPVKVKTQRYKSEKCVRKNNCVEMTLAWPVLSGGNAKATKAINDSIRAFVYLAAEADPSLPLPRALDTAMTYSLAMLKDQTAEMEDSEMGYFYELESKVLLNKKKYISLSMGQFIYTGGAHPGSYVQMSTYDLQTGRRIRLDEIIRDTIALRPMLEKEFLAAKTEPGQPAPVLSEILFEDFKVLPMPENYAVTAKGVEFYYNPYEVAAYVFGPTNFTLSWEALGKLADRRKWGL